MSDGGGKTAVVLLSGGLDSSVAMAIAMEEDHRVHALTVDYGQRHRRELEAARAMARHHDVEHKVVRVDLGAFGGSALTDGAMSVPSREPRGGIGSEIPPTYVPARNTVFLSMALSWAEALSADAVFIGANSVDYSGYPDCRPEFLEAFQRVADLGTRTGVVGIPIRIEAPVLRESKAAIVRRGLDLGVPFQLTWSCYRGTTRACGTCDSCRLRLRGFAQAGAVDPLEYEEGVERPDVEAEVGAAMVVEDHGRAPSGKPPGAEPVEEEAEEEDATGDRPAGGGG